MPALVPTNSVSCRFLRWTGDATRSSGGKAQIISSTGPGEIVGAHSTGAHVSDLIAEGTLEITTGATDMNLASIIHAHPTLSEVLQEIAFKVADKPLHG